MQATFDVGLWKSNRPRDMKSKVQISMKIFIIYLFNNE